MSKEDILSVETFRCGVSTTYSQLFVLIVKQTDYQICSVVNASAQWYCFDFPIRGYSALSFSKFYKLIENKLDLKLKH